MKGERKGSKGFMPEKPPLRPERPPAVPHQSKLLLDKIEDAVRSVEHGTVQVIIQDGHIIQIDKTEKLRLK